MITETLQEIESTRAKLAALEATAAKELRKELASLPGKYGFDSAKAFIKAVKSAAGGRSGLGRGAGRGGRRRAKITDETRAQVKKLVGQNKTGSEIAKTLGISLPSVQNVKKALGLVRKSRK